MLHSIRYKFIIITTVLIIFSANLVFFLAINEHEDLYRQSVKQNLDAIRWLWRTSQLAQT